MAVLTLADASKLKELVGQYGYALHLHDACGAQSFTLEVVGDKQSEQVYNEIEKFFTARQMVMNFYDKEKLNFVAK